MNKNILILVCYLNRTLRYGDSKNKLFQYIIIKSRNYLKRIIKNNSEAINAIGNIKVKMQHAGWMQLKTTDFIDRWLFTGADFEPPVVRTLLKLLSKGDNFLDLGSNIGYFSLIASTLVGEEGMVYAFEPTPETIKRFRYNIELNKIKNIWVIEKAVSNKNGVAIFKTPNDTLKNSGRSSLRNIEENCIELRVQTITIDSILNELRKISVIKMDIEGAEGLALEGMVNLLFRDRPMIIMELTDTYLQQMGYSANRVLNFFQSQKYKVFKIENYDMEVKSERVLSEHQFEVICIPSEKKLAEIPAL